MTVNCVPASVVCAETVLLLLCVGCGSTRSILDNLGFESKMSGDPLALSPGGGNTNGSKSGLGGEGPSGGGGSSGAAKPTFSNEKAPPR